MEFVARRVRKDFPGRGTLFGLVHECLPVTGLFKIIYDGGGSEELNLWELLPLLISSEPPPPQHPPEVSVAKVKRKAKKPPHRVVSEGETDDGSISGGFVDKSGNLVKLGLDSTDEGVDMHDEGDHGRNLGKLHGFDLNQAAHVGLDVNEGTFVGSSGVKRKMIDLNLDVDKEIDAVKISEKKVKWFDLNVEFKEDEDDDNLDGHEGKQDYGGSLINVDGENGDAILNMESKEEIQMENCLSGVEDEKEFPVVAMGRDDRKNEEVVDCKIEMNKMNVEIENLNLRLESRGEIPDKRISDSIDFDVGVSESGSSISSLKEKMDSFAGHDYAFNASGINNQISRPTTSVVSDEKLIVSGHESLDEALVLPSKVDLPPSSGGFDLDGVSVFDIVSVYAFLRSFSTLLFLSPFELDDFVTCVKCDDSTSLFDSIHVSILRTLRLHLVFLSKEGSPSATTCLRSLNWDFLDLITWPIFLVGYLLYHSPGYIPGLDLSHFEVFHNDYYKTSASAKINILRHLCDDVIEIESFKLEINRRTLTAEHIVMDIATTVSITDQDADEPTDLNGDECFLCKNDGNLICCDGCPAAFHSRCVGVVSSLLPEGDWYCPECAFDKNKPWTRIGKSIRGAELLGNDLHGRQFYSSCGYLLV